MNSGWLGGIWGPAWTGPQQRIPTTTITDGSISELMAGPRSVNPLIKLWSHKIGHWFPLSAYTQPLVSVGASIQIPADKPRFFGNMKYDEKVPVRG